MIPPLTKIHFSELQEIQNGDVECIDFSAIAIVKNSATGTWWLVLRSAMDKKAPDMKVPLEGHMPELA